ncbi:MAG: hypothetical protein V8R80_02975 [Eubacterium sp.]
MAKYRKNGGTVSIPKYDYTSYDDDIPYYRIIVMENKQKINIAAVSRQYEMLALKRLYPQKIYLQ